ILPGTIIQEVEALEMIHNGLKTRPIMVENKDGRQILHRDLQISQIQREEETLHLLSQCLEDQYHRRVFIPLLSQTVELCYRSHSVLLQEKDHRLELLSPLSMWDRAPFPSHCRIQLRYSL